MKNADMPAMPSDVKDVYEAMTGGSDSWGKAALGLTKREMMAMHILSGLLSDYEFDATRQMAAEIAVEQADALLAELEKHQ